MTRERKKREGGLPVTGEKPGQSVKQVEVEPIDECTEQRQYTGHHVCAARQGGRAMPSVGDACCTQRSPSLWPFDQSGDKNIVCRYHRVAAPARRVLWWGAVDEERKRKARLTDWVGGARPRAMPSQRVVAR